MHYSGVLIMADPAHLQEAAELIDGLEGVHVQFTYPESGRLIAVLETERVEGQQQALRTIQALRHVKVAELVYHRLDEEGEQAQHGQAKRLRTV